MTDSEKEQLAYQYLLAEYEALQERIAGLEQARSGQVNFFLVIVAAFVASLSGFYDLLQGSKDIWIIAAAGSFILFLVGFSTLHNSVDYSISVIVLYRRAGRIRRRFWELDKAMLPYLPYEPADDRPKIKLATFYLGYRGGEPVLLIINALALAAFFLALLTGIFSLPIFALTIIAVILVTGIWFLQLKYVSRKLARSETHYEKPEQVHFPLATLQADKATVVEKQDENQQVHENET
jgi:hypothetical protein